MLAQLVSVALTTSFPYTMYTIHSLNTVRTVSILSGWFKLSGVTGQLQREAKVFLFNKLKGTGGGGGVVS